MYHLKLIKGLSYKGIVTATKGKPDVLVEDKATADEAVATGYFALIEGKAAAAKPEKQPETVTGHLDAEQLGEWKFDDLKKLAADMGIETKELKKKADLIEAIVAAEVEAPAGDDEDDNEADYGEGSPTMIELQKQ